MKATLDHSFPTKHLVHLSVVFVQLSLVIPPNVINAIIHDVFSSVHSYRSMTRICGLFSTSYLFACMNMPALSVTTFSGSRKRAKLHWQAMLSGASNALTPLPFPFSFRPFFCGDLF